MGALRETIYNPVTGEEVTFLQTKGESGSSVTVVEVLLAPRGKGPPVHYHRSFSETFHCLEGALMLKLGADTMCLREGQEALAKPGQLHTFWSESDHPVRFRGTIDPGNVDAENCFRIAFGLARDGFLSSRGVPRRLSHMAILATMSQSHLRGMGGVIVSLLGVLARTTSFQSIQRDLVGRYCP